MSTGLAEMLEASFSGVSKVIPISKLICHDFCIPQNHMLKCMNALTLLCATSQNHLVQQNLSRFWIH